MRSPGSTACGANQKGLSPTGTSSLSPREPLSSVAPPGSTAARTVESPPPVALMAFGSALPLARRYAELLSTTAVDRGILGPREGARIWARHLLNCAAVAELVPGAASVADLGAGAAANSLLARVRRRAETRSSRGGADPSRTVDRPSIRRRVGARRRPLA